MRDAAVQDAVDELFRAHDRLKSLPCEIVVKGGVAHVHGTLPSNADREHVRHALARIRGVNAVWDTLNTRGNGELRIVDIGCGGAKQIRDAIGVDAHPHDGVDIVCNLENGLPFADGEIDYVFAVHFLEHVSDLIGLMNEIHRVLKPGGVLHAMVPNVSHANAIADPTHVRYFNRQTFKYFCTPHTGVRLFRPVCVTSTRDNVLADLQPVPSGQPAAPDRDLALFFD